MTIQECKSVTRLFIYSSQPLTSFAKKASLQTFDWVLNAPLVSSCDAQLAGSIWTTIEITIFSLFLKFCNEVVFLSFWGKVFLNFGARSKHYTKILRIWSYSLKKFLMKNFIFCAVEAFRYRIKLSLHFIFLIKSHSESRKFFHTV